MFDMTDWDTIPGRITVARQYIPVVQEVSICRPSFVISRTPKGEIRCNHTTYVLSSGLEAHELLEHRGGHKLLYLVDDRGVVHRYKRRRAVRSTVWGKVV
jgi:hypothetical protein